MALKAEVLDALLDAGASAEMIVAAIKADMAQDELRREAKRSSNAERQQRYRDKRKNRKSRGSNADNALRPVTPPIEDNHTPSVLSPNGEKHSTAKPRDPFPMPEWCEDEQVWADFLANRKRKRLPNTPTAHKGFLDDIARISSPEWPPWRLLKHATAKGWGGIYDPTGDRTPGNDNRKPNSARNTADLARAKLGLGQ